MTEAPPPPPEKTTPTLPFKHLFNHFFLLHDFFHKITKTKAHNSAYFDLQIEIYTGMTNAVKTGSKVAQFVTSASLITYFLKGNSIKLRFLYGFLFMYWYNHVMTLGSYAGVLCRMPHLYKRTAQYYETHGEENNLIKSLNEFMEKQDMYEDPQQEVLQKLFQADIEQKSFVANQFFVKNKQKYLPKEVLEWNNYHSKKLPYFDSFLTRYIYYSFTRWWARMRQFLSVKVINQ